LKSALTDGALEIKAQVQAAAATIFGIYEGDLVCSGKLTIGASAQVQRHAASRCAGHRRGCDRPGDRGHDRRRDKRDRAQRRRQAQGTVGTPTSIAARAPRREPSFAMVAPAEDRPPSRAAVALAALLRLLILARIESRRPGVESRAGVGLRPSIRLRHRADGWLPRLLR